MPERVGVDGATGQDWDKVVGCGPGLALPCCVVALDVQTMQAEAEVFPWRHPSLTGDAGVGENEADERPSGSRRPSQIARVNAVLDLRRRPCLSLVGRRR